MFLGQYILPDQNKGLQINWEICICKINYIIFHLGASQLFPIQYQAEPLSLTKKWNFSNQPVHNNWNLQVDYHKKHLNWHWLENCHYRHDIRSGVSRRQPAHLLECYWLETAHQKSFIKTNRPMKTILTTVNHSISLCPPPTHTKKEQPRTHQR